MEKHSPSPAERHKWTSKGRLLFLVLGALAYGLCGHCADVVITRPRSAQVVEVHYGGGWSDLAALKRCRDPDVVFIPVLAMGMTAGAPWQDMWDTNVIARMHQVARDQIFADTGRSAPARLSA